MATSNQVTIHKSAGGTITQFAVVYLAADGDAEVTTANTDVPFGIALNAASAGENVEICIWGDTYAVATDANVAAGELIEAVASGEVDTFSAGAAALSFGIALEDAPAANDYMRVFITGRQRIS